MRDPSSNERLLFRYLLGQVSEEEQAQVEQRFIGEADFYEELLLMEDELRCAYAQGSLPPAERERFETRFLIFPDERKKVSLAEAMIAELSNRPAVTPSESVPEPREERSGRERLLDRLGFRKPTFGFAMAAAALLLLLPCALLIANITRSQKQVTEMRAREQEVERQTAEERSRVEKLSAKLEEERNSRAILEKELAGLRNQASNGEATRPFVISLSLFPGLIRGDGETKRLTVPQSATEIRILLNLGEKSGYRAYQAGVLNSEGKLVWNRSALKPTQGRANKFVVLRILSAKLTEDDYEIELRGLTEIGEAERIASYYFTVLKK